MLLISTALLMLFFMICKLCGLSYFKNDYPSHDASPVVQQLILITLSILEYWLVAMILTPTKWWICLLVAVGYNCLFFIPMPQVIVTILSYAYMVFVGFVLSRFQYKRITYGIILAIVLTIYQLIMMLGRYTIDLTAKFNYLAMVASLADYKLFVFNIFLLIKIRRKQQNERKSEQISAA